MSSTSNPSAHFDNLRDWILHTEGNVQYRAKLVRINIADTYITVNKFKKASEEDNFKPTSKQVFLPPKAFFGLEHNITAISKELRKLVAPDTISMCTIFLYRKINRKDCILPIWPF